MTTTIIEHNLLATRVIKYTFDKVLSGKELINLKSCFVILAFLSLPFNFSNAIDARAVGRSYPRIIPTPEKDVEKILLSIAERAFLSTSFDWRILDTFTPEPNAPYELILQHRLGENDEEGYYEYYWHSPDYVHHEKLNGTNDHDSSSKNERHYWLKEDHSGGRFVVSIVNTSWRGALHKILWIKGFDAPKYCDKENLLNISEIPRKAVANQITTEALYACPLLLLRIKKTGKIIAIIRDRGNLGSWRVFIPTKGDDIKRYTIDFFDASKNNPAPFNRGSLKKIRVLLDAILGIDHNEGSESYSCRIRDNVAKILLNIASRPWVFKTKPNATDYFYNSIDEIEVGLIKWSHGHQVFARQLKELKNLYPKAEHELSLYYQSRFGFSDKIAKETAKRLLLILYGAHFVFPKNRKN